MHRSTWFGTVKTFYRSVGRSRREAIVRAFTRLSYSELHTYHSSYHGHKLYKWPTDLWVYQELIWRTRPTLIVETGTFSGASALFFAHQLDLLGEGSVITVDVDAVRSRPVHPRITYLTGSSVDPQIVKECQQAAAGAAQVMVVLDSDHSYAHVRAELEQYADLVTPDSYLVVEDTIVNGHPVLPEFGPGPMEAVHDFLERASSRFVVDRECERFLLTQNPGGYLRRLAA